MAILDPVKLGSFVDDPSADDANIAFARINANEKLLNEEVRPIATGGTGNTTGLAASATKLETARTLSWTGDVTGSSTFDGTANKATAMTLAASGVTAGTFKSVTVNAKGLVTAGNDVVTGLVTATTAAGTANAATTNSNTFLNITEKVGAATASAGTSTQITGAGTVTVASDTAGKITVTGAAPSVFTTDVAGLVPARIGAVATKYLREDGTWVTPTNTTYTNMSAAEITAGTATTGRLITPKDLKTAVGTYNAATTSKLLNPVKINGTDFDGTQDINIASMPMGMPLFHGGTRATIETGYVAYDGQLLNRVDHPAMWAKVQATFPIITDADWLANPSKRGSYSSGDGTTTFRMPDYNGVQTDSLKGLFLRGDGGGTIGGVAVSSGTTVLNDAIRNITGHVQGRSGNTLGRVFNTGANGAFAASGEAGEVLSGSISAVGDRMADLYFDASKVVPTASENRPVSAVGVWICRVGNTLTEIANPTLHAVLTGGNTFNGGQAVVGDLSVSGNFTVDGVGMFGVGQYWQDVTASRALSVDYTNTSGKLVKVNVSVVSGGAGLFILVGRVNGMDIDVNSSQASGAGMYLTCSIEVPNGKSYVFARYGDATVHAWNELS